MNSNTVLAFFIVLLTSGCSKQDQSIFDQLERNVESISNSISHDSRKLYTTVKAEELFGMKWDKLYVLSDEYKTPEDISKVIGIKWREGGFHYNQFRYILTKSNKVLAFFDVYQGDSFISFSDCDVIDNVILSEPELVVYQPYFVHGDKIVRISNKECIGQISKTVMELNGY